MSGQVFTNNFTDNNGDPLGGVTYGPGFAIAWQHGPLGQGKQRLNPTGASVEDILEGCRQRLEFYQTSRFACEENKKAMVSIEAALMWLQQRTADRLKRGVEGANLV